MPSSQKQLEGSCEAWHPLFPSPADLQVCELRGMKQQVPCPEITSQALDGVAPPGTLRSVRVPAEAPLPPRPVPWLAHTPCAKPLDSSPQTGPAGAPNTLLLFLSLYFCPAKVSCPPPHPSASSPKAGSLLGAVLSEVCCRHLSGPLNFTSCDTPKLRWLGPLCTPGRPGALGSRRHRQIRSVRLY